MGGICPAPYDPAIALKHGYQHCNPHDVAHPRKTRKPHTQTNILC